ncbi:UDP-glucose 4-epimerase GalE [Methylophilaceae bacterium Uisw_099_01]
MNILLTGGTGYIGSHTAVDLVLAGHKVILFDNLSNSCHEVVGRIDRITNQNISFVKGDVRDTSLLSKTIKEKKVDAVMHFAGLKAVGESVKRPLDYFNNNVGGTISLLEAMQENQVKTLVFSSSATVYGEPQYLPIDENHPTSATNPYGRTKLHIERMLQDIVTSDSAFKVVCLRYFNPAGAHESGLIGESPDGVPNNLIPFLSQVAAGKHSKVNVFGDDYPTVDGTGVRDYIHVLDLASGHLAALNYLTDKKGWYAINLGTGNGSSVLEMIGQFALSSARSIPYEIVDRRPGDVAACYATAEKAHKLLNWKATRDLKSMCSSAWKWQESLK